MNPNDPYLAYYHRQQAGGAISSIFRGGEVSSVFRGGGVQKGDGIGSFLGGLFRTVAPLLKSGATAVGKEALRSGVGFLRDITDGATVPREAASARLKQFTSGLKRRADDKIGRVLQGGGGVAVGYKKRRVDRVTHQSLAKLLGPQSRTTLSKGKKKRRKTTKQRKTPAKKRATKRKAIKRSKKRQAVRRRLSAKARRDIFT